MPRRTYQRMIIAPWRARPRTRNSGAVWISAYGGPLGRVHSHRVAKAGRDVARTHPDPLVRPALDYRNHVAFADPWMLEALRGLAEMTPEDSLGR